MTTGRPAAEWRRILVPPFILLAFVAGAAFAWYSAHSLLMLFAGILFAVFLDACTRGLGYILPLSRAWRFGLVALVLASLDRKSTRLNSSHSQISYAVFCLKKKKKKICHAQ